ncbi:MAG: hypothetical protein K8R92_00915 [Planctomycetes bacterium]|nr:hypothetical protein [Planctomycetota bacterium]
MDATAKNQKRSRLNGLHLWRVTRDHSHSRGLWITTKTESMTQALAKAKRVIREKFGDGKGARVTQINHRGTLNG